MKRRDLLKLFTISPIIAALKAGKITAAPTNEVMMESTAVGRKAMTLNETEVLQFREGEIKEFQVPDCKSMTFYAPDENAGPIHFGAEKDPAVDGLKLQPGRQFVAGDVPAAKIYAGGIHDDIMIISFRS